MFEGNNEGESPDSPNNDQGQDQNGAAQQNNDSFNGMDDLAASLKQDSGSQDNHSAPQQSEDNNFASSSSDNSDTPADNSDSHSSSDLADLKQQALQQLTPLVGHLDQTPLEKFRTTMMLIQASDNQALLKDALESAKQIEDDKIRAQALLDVINEINYFTQSKQNQS